MSKLKDKIEEEAKLHETQYDQSLGLPQSWGPAEDFKFGAEFGLKLGREEACVLVEALEWHQKHVLHTQDLSKCIECIALAQYKKSVEES